MVCKASVENGDLPSKESSTMRSISTFTGTSSSSATALRTFRVVPSRLGPRDILIRPVKVDRLKLPKSLEPIAPVKLLTHDTEIVPRPEAAPSESEACGLWAHP